MGPLGWQETVAIGILALLIFGPRKLPELGRTIGKAMGEFRRATSDLKATLDREMSSIEQENQSLRETTYNYTKSLYEDHDYSYDAGAYGTDTYETSASTAQPTTPSASAPQGADAASPANGTAVATTVSNTHGAATSNGTHPQGPAPAAPLSETADGKAAPETRA